MHDYKRDLLCRISELEPKASQRLCARISTEESKMAVCVPGHWKTLQQSRLKVGRSTSASLVCVCASRLESCIPGRRVCEGRLKELEPDIQRQCQRWEHFCKKEALHLHLILSKQHTD